MISPLLANVYLHDFDRASTVPTGPPSSPTRGWCGTPTTLWSGAVCGATASCVARTDARTGPPTDRESNQDARSVCHGPAAESGLSGLSTAVSARPFRPDAPLFGGGSSPRAVARLREKLRGLTQASAKRSLRDTIDEVNTLLRGWSAYFRYGYPRHAFRAVNYYVQGRFRCFLRNRSQRRSRPFRQGESLYAGLHRYGLHSL